MWKKEKEKFAFTPRQSGALDSSSKGVHVLDVFGNCWRFDFGIWSLKPNLYCAINKIDVPPYLKFGWDICLLVWFGVVGFKHYKSNESRYIRILSKHIMDQICEDYVVSAFPEEALVGKSPFREGGRKVDLSKLPNYEDVPMPHQKWPFATTAQNNAFGKSCLSTVTIGDTIF